ncbi:hypothetical protein [Sphingobium cupriresistens]|uniref:Uncharacterized protein n=1 Tax=Sphingobium cupriresistens LL01 TaxID=1420583 RepID=A0A0J7XSP7_9SPHN|nr:hypothetical protein [Sphingobium cupriresistens]KMS54702.1 hypothetical protein V473_15230 [Sphingobium cupriresistens LL01]
MTFLDRFAPLANEAAAAVQRREAQYPTLIEAGKLPADQAAQEIRVWHAIAADWRWVVTLERIEAAPATLAEKVEALEESTRRAERAMRRAFAASDSSVQDAWAQDMPMAEMATRYGEATTRFFAEWERYWCFADLLAWYRRDLPDSEQPGIAHYVEAETRRSCAGRAAA